MFGRDYTFQSTNLLFITFNQVEQYIPQLHLAIRVKGMHFHETKPFVSNLGDPLETRCHSLSEPHVSLQAHRSSVPYFINQG